MPVEIRLTSEQLPHFNEAMLASRLEVKQRGQVIVFTREDYDKVTKALQKQHDKSFKLKTKSITHVERIYHLGHIIDRVNQIGEQFREAIPVINDNEFDDLLDQVDEATSAE